MYKRSFALKIIDSDSLVTFFCCRFERMSSRRNTGLIRVLWNNIDWAFIGYLMIDCGCYIGSSCSHSIFYWLLDDWLWVLHWKFLQPLDLVLVTWSLFLDFRLEILEWTVDQNVKIWNLGKRWRNTKTPGGQSEHILTLFQISLQTWWGENAAPCIHFFCLSCCKNPIHCQSYAYCWNPVTHVEVELGAI